MLQISVHQNILDRDNGHTMPTFLAVTIASGIAPNMRESFETKPLSPSIQTCPCGTVTVRLLIYSDDTSKYIVTKCDQRCTVNVLLYALCDTQFTAVISLHAASCTTVACAQCWQNFRCFNVVSSNLYSN
jgi:hypothetical protein